MSTEKAPVGGPQGRGSSPYMEEQHGKDDWVRGIRLANGTPEEWLANARAEDLAAIGKQEGAPQSIDTAGAQPQ